MYLNIEERFAYLEKNDKIMDFSCPADDVETKFMCSVCNKIFFIKSHFNDHLYSHIHGKSLIKEICCKGFSEISELNEYFHKYKQNDSWICHACGTTHFSKRDLIDHFSVHINEDPYICKPCKKVFKNKKSLFAHNATHFQKLQSPAWDFVCRFCNEIFAFKIYLDQHTCLEKYSAEKYSAEKYSAEKYSAEKYCEEKYTCHICSQGFGGKPALYKHYFYFHKN